METDIPRSPRLLDGATKTNLFSLGMPCDICPEDWILEHPNILKKLQSEYVKAGSDIVYAPTFSANRACLARFGHQSNAVGYNQRLVELTKKAAGKKLVAGNLSPTLLSVEPYGETSFDELVDIYSEQAEALNDAGVDLFAIETMLSVNEARAAVLSLRRFKKPVYVTVMLNEHGKMYSGASPLACLITLQELGVSAFGFNCTSDFDTLCEVIREIAPFAEIPLIAKPCAGHENPILRNRYDISPAIMKGLMEKVLDAGASIIGGCCGTTPRHIAEMRSLIDNYLPKNKSVKPNVEHDILLTNERELFSLDNDRIEFTGPVKCEFDMADSILSAENDSNDVLMIYVETPEEAYEFSQNVHLAKLPICLHSNSEQALERALFLYNGRCMVDKTTEIPNEALADLARKYGAVVY